MEGKLLGRVEKITAACDIIWGFSGGPMFEIFQDFFCLEFMMEDQRCFTPGVMEMYRKLTRQMNSFLTNEIDG